MSWTQPICDDCWEREYPSRAPIRFREEYAKEETCCLCGAKTRSGIYVRRDPKTCAHPHGGGDAA